MGVAFLVDGHTEQRFIQRICPKKTVQRINLNGSSVGASAIAKRIATQVRLWGGKYFPIIIIIDLEDRDVSHTEFADDLVAELRNQGIEDSLIVGVADRMIENWIVADAQLLGWDDVPVVTDGIHGAGKLKELKGVYDKAGDGPDLLSRARPSRIRARSPSFDALFNKLPILPGCHWLQR